MKSRNFGQTVYFPCKGNVKTVIWVLKDGQLNCHALTEIEPVPITLMGHTQLTIYIVNIAAFGCGLIWSIQPSQLCIVHQLSGECFISIKSRLFTIVKC